MATEKFMLEGGKFVLDADGKFGVHEDCCCCECPGHPPLLDSYTVAWDGTATTTQCPDCDSDLPASPQTFTKSQDCWWASLIPIAGNLALGPLREPAEGCLWTLELWCVDYLVWKGQRAVDKGEADWDIVGAYTEVSKCGTVSISNVTVS